MSAPVRGADTAPIVFTVLFVCTFVGATVTFPPPDGIDCNAEFSDDMAGILADVGPTPDSSLIVSAAPPLVCGLHISRFPDGFQKDHFVGKFNKPVVPTLAFVPPNSPP